MRAHGSRGFTLIELMVTISIVAILLGLVTPSFTSLLNTNRLATQANDILGALTVARSEAIRLDRRVVLCRSDDGANCSTASDRWPGWLLFVDNDNNDTPSATEILRVGTIASDTVSVQGSSAISGQQNRIRTGSDGFARVTANSSAALLQAKISVCIATASPAENAREIRIVNGGRAMIVSVNNNSTCPIPSNS